MLRKLLQTSMTKLFRSEIKVLSPNKTCRSLFGNRHFFIHTTSSDGKALGVKPVEKISDHLESIRSRRMYLDDIYQHVPGSVKNIEIVDDGKKLEITWEDGRVSNFHAIWLRHYCHCPDCLPYTSTVLVDFSKIDIDSLRIVSATLDGPEIVVLKWMADSEEKEHTGPIPTRFLRYQCYSEDSVKERRKQRVMKFHDKKVVPEIQHDEVMAGEEGVYKWMMALSEYGLCVVKNVPRERGYVVKITERIADIQHTIYGDYFDVESEPKPINAAYTGIGLDLHMDQIHYESPPGLQLLHCLEFDECIQGGENFFVDLHEIAHKFKKEYPDLFYTLTRVPSSVNTVDYLREPPSQPAHVRIQRPLITVNHYDEIVSVLWQPMLIAPLQVQDEDVLKFYKAYKQFYTMIHYCNDMYRNRLRAGDMISFNNRRVLHGRTAYTENGRRLLQGTYVNISEFQSKLQIYHNKYGSGEWPIRCGSIDYQ